MDTIEGGAVSASLEGLRQQLDEARRQNARMARSGRRERWAFALAGVMGLVAVGGPAGMGGPADFKAARAQMIPRGVPVGLPTHLTRVGRYLIGVHNIRHAYRSQNGIGTVYFVGSDQALTLNAEETAQLFTIAVQ